MSVWHFNPHLRKLKARVNGGRGEIQGEIKGQNFAIEPNKLMIRERDKSMREEVGTKNIFGRKKIKGGFFFQNVERL